MDSGRKPLRRGVYRIGSEIVKGVPSIDVYAHPGARGAVKVIMTRALHEQIGRPAVVQVFVADAGMGLQMLVVDVDVLWATGEYERYAKHTGVEFQLMSHDGKNSRRMLGDWSAVPGVRVQRRYVPIEYTRGGALFNL